MYSAACQYFGLSSASQANEATEAPRDKHEKNSKANRLALAICQKYTVLDLAHGQSSLNEQLR